MLDRIHRQPGKFNWRCLLAHAWGAWSPPMIRTYVAGGLLGNDYVWTQRKCQRCGAQQGRETLGDE